MGGSRVAAGEGRRAPDQAVGRRAASRTSAPRGTKQEAIELELDAPPPPVAGGRRATELAMTLLAELCACADGCAVVTAPQEGRRRGGAAAAAPWPADRSCGRRYETGGKQEGLCMPEQGQAGGPLLAGAGGSKVRIGSRRYEVIWSFTIPFQLI